MGRFATSCSYKRVLIKKECNVQYNYKRLKSCNEPYESSDVINFAIFFVEFMNISGARSEW